MDASAVYISEIIMQDVFILKNIGSWGIMVLEKSKVTFLGDPFFTQNYLFLVLEPFMLTALP